MRIFVATLLVTLALGAGPAPSWAEPSPKEQAKRYFQEGKVLFNLGKFPAAIREFERSYRLYDAPEILFMIGQCHNHMGHHRQAIYFYRRFLAEKPSAPNAAAIEEMITGLEAKVAASPSPPPTPPPVPAKAPEPPKATAPKPPPPPPKPVVAKVTPLRAVVPPPTPMATRQPTPALDLTPSRPPADEPAPIYRKWWFWGGVGAAVVTIVVVSAVVASGGGAPSGGVGTIDCSNPSRGCVVLSLRR